MKGAMEKVREIWREGRRVGKEDPRRIVHSFKVGLALALVSSFYYYQPLYDNFGVNAMWAVMTVVVVFEFSVGATLGKGINRALATLVAGGLGVGAHHLASLSGPTIEPILLAVFVFVQEFGEEYFEATDDGDVKEVEKKRKNLQRYKSVLNSKSNEEALANFAKWEPRHGQFRFRHPWKQYLAVAALLRQCAYWIDALNSYIASDFQIPMDIKKKLEEPLTKMSSESRKSMKEVSISSKKMRKSSSYDIHVLNSQSACKDLTTLLKTGILNDVEPLQMIALMTTVSLLIDIVNLTEKIAESVHELASAARFENKKKSTVSSEKTVSDFVSTGRSVPIKSQDDHVVTILCDQWRTQKYFLPGSASVCDDDISNTVDQSRVESSVDSCHHVAIKIDDEDDSVHEKHEDGEIRVHTSCVSYRAAQRS
ncbi:hypothetical protein F2Q69_00060487 [Brassica cretica]|uniref:Aluminum-activated malate transporter n=1 Tax=Brassica cretica TaxID=69181 RepID=A0A8S9RE46_BRACR|nr:hypothetical protein F2Q69_00060487 [Brassica cretica]